MCCIWSTFPKARAGKAGDLVERLGGTLSLYFFVSSYLSLDRSAVMFDQKGTTITVDLT